MTTISNRDPGYLRELADMETEEARPLPVAIVTPELEALWREVMALHERRAVERATLVAVNEDIRRAVRLRNETEAALQALDGQMGGLLERMQEGIRS